MSGSIVKWVADEGAVVEAGDPLLVLEAMKMETTINAHRAARWSAATCGRARPWPAATSWPSSPSLRVRPAVRDNEGPVVDIASPGAAAPARVPAGLP